MFLRIYRSSCYSHGPVCRAYANRQTSIEQPHPDVVSWLDDILISNYVRAEHLATVANVVTKVSHAPLSVKFTKRRFASSSQEFLGRVVDDTEMRPSPSKLEAMADMPVASNVEQLR